VLSAGVLMGLLASIRIFSGVGSFVISRHRAAQRNGLGEESVGLLILFCWRFRQLAAEARALCMECTVLT